MSQPHHGINRQGLDTAFEAEEARKSDLLLASRLSRQQGQNEAAAVKLAEAAGIEESLAERCAALGLVEKEWVHRFSAASCWAQAGNFYQAIALCDGLLARSELPERWRSRVQEYVDTLRARRAQWYAELALETAGTEG